MLIKNDKYSKIGLYIAIWILNLTVGLQIEDDKELNTNKLAEKQLKL